MFFPVNTKTILDDRPIVVGNGLQNDRAVVPCEFGFDDFADGTRMDEDRKISDRSEACRQQSR